MLHALVFAHYHSEWELTMDYVPSVAAHGEGELPEDDVESGIYVQYKGSSNFRILSRADLCGDKDHPGHADELVWTPGSKVSWGLWMDYAGSPERAVEVFRTNAQDFILVGPGAEEILNGDSGEEEFVIGESVA